MAFNENYSSEFFKNVISLLIKCKRQPDNERDSYAAKCKHYYGLSTFIIRCSKNCSVKLPPAKVTVRALIL